MTITRTKETTMTDAHVTREQVWTYADRLMGSILAAIKRIDELGPSFLEEFYEARDPATDMQVGDSIERLARHSLQHRHELTSIRASIGESRPTDPSDVHPASGQPVAPSWYHWFLLEAFLRRAEMVSDLIGLSDADLDKKPDPAHVATNERTVRDVCEHVLHVQDWLMRGIESGLAHHRAGDADAAPGA
jgi:hypothetical protein